MPTNRYEYYRFPGPRPFHGTYRDQCLFFGRDQEKQTLLQEVLAHRLVVLYGPSGVGKTSLINVGVSPGLWGRNFIPFRIRFDQPGIEPLSLIFNRINEIAAQHHLYIDPGEENSPWQYFKTLVIRSPDNSILQPVLILDRLEDFFLFTSREKGQHFIRQLAEVVNNTVPKSLRESIKPGSPLLYNLTPPGVKIIITVPGNFIGKLEELSCEYPGFFNCRFKLEGLSREQAKQAIVGPTLSREEAVGPSFFQFSPGAVELMLDFLSQPKETQGFAVVDEVEPFSLQLLCRDVEEKAYDRWKRGARDIVIEPGDLGGERGLRKTLHSFYDNQVKRLDSWREKQKARRLCEKGLIKGTRRLKIEKTRIEDKFGVSGNLSGKLESGGLVQTETLGEESYYELSHEKLVPLIRESSLKNGIMQLAVLGVIIVGILIVVGMVGRKSDHRVRGRPIGKQEVLNYFINRGNIHLRRGKYREAEESFLEAARFKPDYAPTYNILGISLVRQGKYGEAISAYRKAVDLSPGFDTARANLAEAALLAEHFEMAFMQAQEVLKPKKNNPDINLVMRLVSISALLYQGKKPEAFKELKAFIVYYNGLSGEYGRVWDFRDINEFRPIKWELPPGQIQVMLRLLGILKGAKTEGNKEIKELEVLVPQVFE